MARIAGLVEEIESVFGARAALISKIYLAKKYFYLPGCVIGLIAGIASHNLTVFVFIGCISSIVIYFYAERHLLEIDNEFFSFQNCSKRDIFNKFYAREVDRNLSLKMTEPWVLGRDEHLTIERRREKYKELLSVELEREFQRSDWRLFVAEVLYYQKR